MLKEYYQNKECHIKHKCQLTKKDNSVDHTIKMEITGDLIIPYWDLRIILQ